MYLQRVNTVFFDTRNVPMEELDFRRWLKTLNIEVTDVKIIAFHRHLSRIILKFSNEDNFNSFTSKNNSSVDFTKDGKTYNIPIHPTEITKLVRVRYVPDEMNLNLIKIKLEHHGTIKKIFREKSKGGLDEGESIETETIGIQMTIKKDIPSFINIDGEKFNVSYRGQPRACNRCGSLDHLIANCPQVTWVKSKEPNTSTETNPTSRAQTTTEVRKKAQQNKETENRYSPLNEEIPDCGNDTSDAPTDEKKTARKRRQQTTTNESPPRKNTSQDHYIQTVTPILDNETEMIDHPEEKNTQKYKETPIETDTYQTTETTQENNLGFNQSILKEIVDDTAAIKRVLLLETQNKNNIKEDDHSQDMFQ